MVDLKLIRDQPDLFKAALRKKRADPGLVDRALEADRRRREVVQQVEALRQVVAGGLPVREGFDRRLRRFRLVEQAE